MVGPELQQAPEHGAPTVLDLTLVPQLEQVSIVREFLEQYFQPVLNDPDLLYRMAVAAHELLENAAKYSAGGCSRLLIGVSDGHPDCSSTLSVSVTNVARPEHVGELKQKIEQILTSKDASEAYQFQMVCAALRGEGSGLGLARIRAEAEMALAMTFEGDRVCVQATTAFNSREHHD